MSVGINASHSNAKHFSRLASILDKRQLSDAKLDQIKIKANVLAAFAAKKAEEATNDGEEKVQDATDAVESEAQRSKEEL